MSAKRTEMSELHELLAKTLKDQIQHTDEPSPAMLNVARQFLKDSGIEVDPDRRPSGVIELEKAFDEHFVDGMPNFDKH